MNQLENYYKDRRVLVTGCHGFKGGWLSAWLSKLGAHVYGLGLNSGSGRTFFPELFEEVREIDVCHPVFVDKFVRDIQPQTVFHLAAQPIVLRSMKDPMQTFGVNTIGTASVLWACRDLDESPRVVAVTSDKCYAPTSDVVKEDSRLGGKDPYSASKACAEIVCDSFRSAYGMHIRTVRAGNVIGGGDYSPHRIVPDLIRASEEKTPLVIRNPNHTRPWQHVLDCCAGYLVAGMADVFPSAINIGPNGESFTVRQLVEAIGVYIPVHVQYGQLENYIESPSLNLSTELAESIGIKPVMGFADAVWMTATWYRAEKTCDMLHRTLEQIDLFEERAHEKEAGWTCDPNWLSNLTP